MSTEELKALPIGALVKSIATAELYEKVADQNNDVYRCSFRKVGIRGLSTKVTKFHGGRVAIPESD